MMTARRAESWTIPCASPQRMFVTARRGSSWLKALKPRRKLLDFDEFGLIILV